MRTVFGPLVHPGQRTAGENGHKFCLHCPKALELQRNVFGVSCGGCQRKLDDIAFQSAFGVFCCPDIPCRAANRMYRCVDCYYGHKLTDKDGNVNLQPSRSVGVWPVLCEEKQKFPLTETPHLLICVSDGCLHKKETIFPPVLWKSRGVLQCSYCKRELMLTDGHYLRRRCGARCKLEDGETHTELFIGSPRFENSGGGGVRGERSPDIEVKQEFVDNQDDDISGDN